MCAFLKMTNDISAAEISAGIVCICVPTIAALGHRRRRRPSTSILNGQSYPRSPRSFGPNQPTGLTERGLFNAEYLEMRDKGSLHSDLVSQYAVITAIRGGTTTPRAVVEGVRGGCGCRTLGITSSPASGGESNSESTRAADGRGGIMKSFRIEQSYV